jgi:hypothetical protein
MIDSAAWHSIRAASKRIVAKELRLTIQGFEHLPPELAHYVGGQSGHSGRDDAVVLDRDLEMREVRQSF